MTYRDYLKYNSFEQIWHHIKLTYGEKNELEASYRYLYDTVLNLPDYPTESSIEVSLDRQGDISCDNVAYSPEELIDREVRIDEKVPAMSSQEIAAHLLYWCSLYGYQTTTEKMELFQEWLHRDMEGPLYNMDDSMVKYAFVDVPASVFTDDDRVAFLTRDKGKIISTLTRILLDLGIGEIDMASGIEVVFFLPDEYVSAFPDISSNLPDMLIETDRIYSREKCNIPEIIKDYMVATKIPYVIVSQDKEFLEDQRPFVLHPEKNFRLNSSEKSHAVEILNRYDHLKDEEEEDTESEEELASKKMDAIIEDSLAKKRDRFWRDTIHNDYGWDWSSNLDLMIKKLAYNAGYIRYTRRHANWKRDVEKMELAIRLLKIVREANGSNGRYINKRNALRFWPHKPDNLDVEKYLHDIYEKKAFHHLWQLFYLHMQEWWD